MGSQFRPDLRRYADLAIQIVLQTLKWNIFSWRKKFDRPVDCVLQNRFSGAVKMGTINEIVYSPEVKGTNTSGYEAAK